MFVFLNFLIVEGQGYVTSYTYGSNEHNNVYIPPAPNLTVNPDLPEEPDADFIIQYIGSNIPEVAKPAIEKATELWGNIISSDVPITISVEFGDPIVSSDYLASTSILYTDSLFANPPIPTHPVDTTVYPLALANKLAGIDLDTTRIDMSITFSLQRHNDGDFTYSTLGQTTNVYDFVSLAFHEIAHGLGFMTSVNDDAGVIKIGLEPLNQAGTYYAAIYDRYVKDNTNKYLDQFPVNSGSVSLTSFVTSDNLFWGGGEGIYGIGQAYPNNPTKLHAPATYSSVSSVSHFDEATYEPDSTNNASIDDHSLLTPVLNPGEIIYSPGKRAAGILADMGWQVSLGSVGLADHFYAIGPSEVDINTEFLIGCELVEGDNTPTYMMSSEWELELLLENGETYSYATGQFGSGDSPTQGITVSSLPDDLDFVRNTKGQLIAKLIVEGIDSDTYYQTDSKSIKINVAPGKPSVSHSMVNNNCSSIELSFYAPGADHYTVFYAEEDDYHFPIILPEGQNTYILDNLDPTKDYDIFVGAYNEINSSYSIPFVRPKCQISIEVYPNPTVQSLDIDSDSVIDHVEVRDVLTPSIGLNKAGDGSSSDLNVDISNLPMGTYTVKVVDENGNMVTKTIVKF